MTFIEYIKKNLNIAALIVLLGFAGNVLAYVYKAAYFFYFHIPASMISFAFYEVVLFSVTPIVLGLLYVYALWITKPPENELAKLKAKYHLKRRIRPVNRFIVFLGCLPISAVQWHITKNPTSILITIFEGIAVLVMISFLVKNNFKAESEFKELKQRKRDERRLERELAEYWSEKIKSMKDRGLSLEEVEIVVREETSAADTTFDQFKANLKRNAKPLKVIIAIIIAFALLWTTAVFGWQSGRFKREYSIIVYQGVAYVSAAEYSDGFICTTYDQTTNNIAPAYRLIPFTEAEVVMLRRIGPLSVKK